MADLDVLTQIDGVVGAVTFGNFGELLEDRGEMTNGVARLVAYIATANTWMVSLQAEQLDRLSSMQWSPCLGYVYRGPIYSLVVGGNQAVMVETSRANYGQLFNLLGVTGQE